MPTDKQRMDFIQRLIDNEDVIEIQENTLIGSQEGAEENPVEIFTILSQFQYGKDARDVIDKAMKCKV